MHKGFGSITWKGFTDVTGIDLDKVVVFGDNTLEVTFSLSWKFLCV